MSSDEDYLIGKVVSCLKNNVAAAKSWMIFAKSVFPQSFPILLQAYKMEYEQQNLEESALCLSELIQKFPSEILLIRELKNIADSLCSDNEDFLKKIFEKLNDDTKYQVMLIVTRNAQNIEEHCELMLLFLKRMPNSRLLQHGKNIIDTLLAAEDRPTIHTPVNHFRKMLVCDALPLILNVEQFEYKFKAIFHLLQKALEFHVCNILSIPPHADSAIRKELECSVHDPNENWKPLLKLLETIALRYRWSYSELLTKNFNELSLQQLFTLIKRKNKTLLNISGDKHRREDIPGFEEAYFCLILTFFYYLYRFGLIIQPKISPDANAVLFNYILMEGLTYPPEECSNIPGNEFKRCDKGYLVVSKNSSETTNMLILSFINAVEAWESLHRHHQLLKEFNSLCKNIKLDSWAIFQEFYIDLLIYQGVHGEAIEHLNNQIKDKTLESSIKNKAALQMASCYESISDYEKALKILFDVIHTLTPSSTYIPSPSLNKFASRYLHFMPYTNKEILHYCISLLLKLYKQKENVEETYQDMVLGYLFILMQYDLEKEYDTFNKCIEKIKNNKSFCFQKFFNYIIHVEILEELSYLATPAGGNLNLEILQTPTFQASKQRAVTRGVNKGAKDDLKQAFINQMARCYDNLDNLYIEFIKEEHAFILITLFDQ